MLPAVLIGLVLLLWLSMARTRRLRWAVAAALAVLAAVAALLAAVFPPALLEITLASVTVAVSGVAVAGAVERRRTAPRPRYRWPFRLALGLVVAGMFAVALAFVPGPFVPSTDTVLPLPAGLQATVEGHDDGDCGSGSCTQTIAVTGRPGQSGADLYATVRRHVADRGWGHGCRRAGWLLDRTTACIELAQRDDRVMIHLSGNRDDLTRLVTLE